MLKKISFITLLLFTLVGCSTLPQPTGKEFPINSINQGGINAN